MARKLALRDALREAMIEEMRRDENVFLMGEEVAEYDGAYKVSKGMLEEFGAPQRGDWAGRLNDCTQDTTAYVRNNLPPATRKCSNAHQPTTRIE